MTMSDDKKPSNAPGPIKPLRGIGSVHHRFVTTPKHPDWEFWQSMPEVKPWQACSLSLNIDPDSMKQGQAWMAGPGHGPIFESMSFPSEEVEQKFGKRLRLLNANLRNREFFSPRTLNMGDSNFNDVRLSEFVSWVRSLPAPWDMPPELVALAQKPDLSAGAPAPAPTPAADLANEEAPDGDEPITTETPQDAEIELRLEELFDPVGTSQLEKMFPADGDRWEKWAERAATNGLKEAREGRAMFNPYRAALWWLGKQNPDGWDLARCRRVLANNLPSRSTDSRHLLTGELE